MLRVRTGRGVVGRGAAGGAVVDRSSGPRASSQSRESSDFWQEQLEDNRSNSRCLVEDSFMVEGELLPGGWQETDWLGVVWGDDSCHGLMHCTDYGLGFLK